MMYSLKRLATQALVRSPVVALTALMAVPFAAEAMPAHAAAGLESKEFAARTAQVELKKPTNTGRNAPYSLQTPQTPSSNGGVVFGSNGCPEGTYLVIWDAPIYDEETGLFVVDTEPTPVCVPDDLEPEG